MPATGPAHARRVVVGETTSAAAALVGAGTGRAYVASHDDVLAGSVPFDGVDVVDIGSGTGLADVVTALRDRILAGGLTVWLEATRAGDVEALRHVDGAFAGLALSEIEHRDQAVFVRLAPASATTADSAATLDDLDTGAAGRIAVIANAPEAATVPKARSGKQHRPKATPPAIPASGPSRLRGLITLMVASGPVVLVCAAVVWLVSDSSRLRDGVVVALLCYLALCQIGAVVVVTLLNRRLPHLMAAAVPAPTHQSGTSGDLKQIAGEISRIGARLTELDDRLGRVDDKVLALATATARGDKRGLEVGERGRLATQRQIAAYLDIVRLVDPPAALPPMSGWPASPDLALHLVEQIRDTRPDTVVECGSGVSTVVMALAMRRFHPQGRVIALEHKDEFRQRTQDLLRRHGVEDIAEVRLAPLASSGLPGHTTAWYDVAAIADLTDIGLLLVDGPPAAGGRAARYPALPLLVDKLAPHSQVVLDDAVRAEERATGERWHAEFPGFAYAHSIEYEKHLVTLTR